MVLDAELLNEFRQLSGEREKRRGQSTDPRGTPQTRGVYAHKECRIEFVGICETNKSRTNSDITIHTYFGVKSVKKQGMIDSVERGTNI